MSNMNWVDNAILLIFIISVLAGLMRGLVKEIISILSWIAAVIVAVLFSTKVAAMFTGSPQVQSAVSNASTSIGMNAAAPVSYVSIGISFIVLFILTLTVGTIINHLISKAVEGGGISFVNRLLGGVFGLGRGFIMVVVAIFVIQLTPLQQQVWWSASQLVNSFQPAVKWLGSYAAPGFETLKTKVSDTLQNTNTGSMLQQVTGGTGATINNQ